MTAPALACLGVGWFAELAQYVAGAPGEAQAALSALALGALLLLAWGLAAEAVSRARFRQARAAARPSRCLFAAAGAGRRRYRLP